MRLERLRMMLDEKLESLEKKVEKLEVYIEYMLERLELLALKSQIAWHPPGDEKDKKLLDSYL